MLTTVINSHRIFVDLWLSAEQCHYYYDGSIQYIHATTLDGRQVRFPANILRSVVSHDGVHGRFAVDFTSDGKFQRISRIR